MNDLVAVGSWYVGRTVLTARAFVFLSHKARTKDVRTESGYSIIEGPYRDAGIAQKIADKRNGATPNARVCVRGTGTRRERL